MHVHPDTWIPIAAWPRPWPTSHALRARIARLERAGQPVPFARRLGRLRLVSPAEWDRWLESQIDAHPVAPPRDRAALASAEAAA